MSLRISLTPDQVEQRLAKLGLVSPFTSDERAVFSAIPPLATSPIVTTEPGIFGFPTPASNAGLTLRNIKSKVGTNPAHQPSVFEHPWYETEAFMDAPCPAGWHFLAMDVQPDSIGQPVDYASSLSRQELELPMAVEVILMLFLHYVETGQQLLFRKHTWCAEAASLDRHVTVGAFGRNGVFLSGHPLSFASRGLGICPKYRYLK